MYFKIAGLWFTKGPVSFAPYLASSSPDPHKARYHFGCRDWHETPVDATCVSFLCDRECLIHKGLLLVLGPTEQHILPRSKLYGSNNGLILPHCCDPKSPGAMKQLLPKADRAHHFSTSLFIPMPL